MYIIGESRYSPRTSQLGILRTQGISHVYYIYYRRVPVGYPPDTGYWSCILYYRRVLVQSQDVPVGYPPDTGYWSCILRIYTIGESWYSPRISQLGILRTQGIGHVYSTIGKSWYSPRTSQLGILRTQGIGHVYYIYYRRVLVQSQDVPVGYPPDTGYWSCILYYRRVLEQSQDVPVGYPPDTGYWSCILYIL